MNPTTCYVATSDLGNPRVGVDLAVLASCHDGAVAHPAHSAAQAAQALADLHDLTLDHDLATCRCRAQVGCIQGPAHTEVGPCIRERKSFPVLGRKERKGMMREGEKKEKKRKMEERGAASIALYRYVHTSSLGGRRWRGGSRCRSRRCLPCNRHLEF